MIYMLNSLLGKTRASNFIIVMVDFSNDIQAEKSTNIFGEFGLAEALATLHGHTKPLTYNWGQLPINSISTLIQLIVNLRGRYLNFSDGIPSDH